MFSLHKHKNPPVDILVFVTFYCCFFLPLSRPLSSQGRYLSLPPAPPELPEDEHDITKLPEFEDNYHSSSSAVTSELHTPVIINPSGENTNIGVGTIEIHNSDDSLNASGSGSSFSAGFENVLDGAGQEEQADSNSRSSDTGDVQGSQMDNLAGGNDTDLSMSSDSDTEDQDE